ncbi:MAG: hypothetical protein U5L06_03490 [Rhodovibrio sp.]|nr:hypothetical protein [Rhodovibrio sp.]
MIALGLSLQAAGVRRGRGRVPGASQRERVPPVADDLIFHLLAFVVRPLWVHLAGFDGQWRYMGFARRPMGSSAPWPWRAWRWSVSPPPA